MKLNRRNLIKKLSQLSASGLMANPATRFFNSLIYNNLNTDQKAAGIRNYLQINLYGAPCRFGFDHLLKPYDENEFVPYKYVANRVKAQNDKNPHDIEFEYNTVKMNGLNVPPQWKQMLPTSSGTLRPLSDLFSNALMIRGCKLDFSGHPLNAMQQIAPVPGDLSLNGVVADASSALFSSISVGNNPVSRSFKSEGSLLTEIPYTEKNYAEYLLKPFVLKQKDRFYEISELENDFDRIAAFYPQKMKNMKDVKKKSVQNMRDNVDKYLAEYSALVAKYRSLINKAFETNTVNFNVLCPQLPLSIKGKSSLKEVLGPFTLLEKLYLEKEAYNFVKSGKLNYWAEEFALAEFLLVNNLSQSILISAPSPDIGYLVEGCTASDKVSLEHLDLSYDEDSDLTTVDFKKNSENFSDGKRKTIKDMPEYIGMDTHSTGLVYEIMGNDIFFRTLSTCILELIDVLKSKKSGNSTLFDETVIHLASEFDRVPAKDGSGSEHNALANPTTIFSGCIKGPQVIGNIYTGSLEPPEGVYYYGTLGNGAPVKELEDSIKIGNVSSTLSTLLRVKPILRRAPSLVAEKNGEVVSLIEKARNVEGVL